MSSWEELAIAITLTMALSLTVVAVIRPPVFAVLKYVCGTDIGARFWTVYASIMIVIGPLFLVASFVAAGADPVYAIRSTIATASLGLIGAFIIMGLAVANSVRPVETKTSRPAFMTTPDQQ